MLKCLKCQQSGKIYTQGSDDAFTNGSSKTVTYLVFDKQEINFDLHFGYTLDIFVCILLKQGVTFHYKKCHGKEYVRNFM